MPSWEPGDINDNQALGTDGVWRPVDSDLPVELYPTLRERIEFMAEQESKRGLRLTPRLAAPYRTLVETAGGFFPSTWEDYRQDGTPKVDGQWALNEIEGANVTRSSFFARTIQGFAEIYSDEIQSVRVAAKGLNSAVELHDAEDRAFLVSGPRGRIKKIFRGLGHPIG